MLRTCIIITAMKIIFSFISIFLIFAVVRGQKVEHLDTEWPPAYKWKAVRNQEDSGKILIMIIPGEETTQNLTIFGSITAFKGANFSSVNEVIESYKSRMDSGSVLTVVDAPGKGKFRWILFKVETPVTRKYPEPESDLYYVVQGEFALYENFVGIRQPNLTVDFIKRWVKIFRRSKLVME